MPSPPDRQERLAAAARALALATDRSDPTRASSIRASSTRASPTHAPSAGRSSRPPSAPPPDPQDGGGEPDPHAIARAIVLRQLTSSPKSRAQLEAALRKRRCPDDVADAVLDRLEEVGLVDDAAYAASLVRSQQSGRGLARRALAHELRRKGVDEETARAAVTEVTPHEERERARELVAKRLRSMHGLDAGVQARRLAAMLARKGYPTEVCLAVVREAIAEAPEHQRD